MASRKVGQPMSDDARKQKSLTQLIGMMNQFVRTDFGGADHIDVVSNRIRDSLNKRGVVLTDDGVKLAAELAIEEASRHVEGVRNRQRPTSDELKRRAECLEDKSSSANAIRDCIFGATVVKPLF